MTDVPAKFRYVGQRRRTKEDARAYAVKLTDVGRKALDEIRIER
mgnify:CR=1 FL=1